MAAEALQILNLSPIPELSEMELSTVLEQLSSVSDPNGEVTDRNVEDILREAEELIDMSSSFKGDSIESKTSCKLNGNNSNSRNNCKNENVTNGNAVNNFDIRLDESESGNDILNISTGSEDPSEKNSKTESLKSYKNEVESSHSELSSARTARSLTNHIQSALDSLRECSEKIEKQSKNSPSKTEASVELVPQLRTDKDKVHSHCENGETKMSDVPSGSYFGEESERLSSDKISDSDVSVQKSSVKQKTEKSKHVKKAVKSLSLDDSLRTLNCFERLYRGRPSKVRVETKRLKSTEKVVNPKKADAKKVVKTTNPTRLERLYKEKKESDALLVGSRNQCSHRFNVKKGSKVARHNLIDEDISFEKCLQLLNEESESQSNGTDLSGFNCNDFAEKLLKECTTTVSALRGEVEDLKTQLKKNVTSDGTSSWDSDLNHKFWSQENLIQLLKEENSKLFQEIDEIKGQLKRSSERESPKDSDHGEKQSDRVEALEKLRTEVENLRRGLITAYSESNGILRLEEQFSTLKQKYDLQIGKLECENLKLREMLAGQSSRCETGTPRRDTDPNRNVDVGVNTDRDCWRRAPSPSTAFEGKPRKDLTRSVSLECCRPFVKCPSYLSQSCESVDAATSPIKSSFSQTDKELCSVSVQCMGEMDGSDADGENPSTDPGRRGGFREFQKLENKENLLEGRKPTGRMRPVLSTAGQVLNSLKARKVSEHENQLMVTLRALHSEINVKDRDNKKLRNEVEGLRNQLKKVSVGIGKNKSEVTKKCCHVGTQTIGLAPNSVWQEKYDPAMFQVSRELENENEHLKLKVNELEKLITQLKEKRIHDLQILQKLHEEEIEKLASRLNTQTALTNHLHLLLTGR